ncbi:MAG: MATE family efflux transporter [Lachnospiraceae bacterium]|nr:MATE family efflux transporter [Lachnospiraceae bacterium]
MKKFKEKFIGDKAFYKMLFAIALPMMIQNGITNFVSLLDNIMVGQLGTEPMSGVAIVNQLIFIFYLCMFGGLSGVGIFTAQYYGNKDDEGIRHTLRYKFWLGLAITIITVTVFVLYGKQLIQLYLNGNNDGGDLIKTLSCGHNYLMVIIFMLPAVYWGMLYSSTLRECGETFIPMISGVIAVFVNLTFNYLLIFGKFGFPKLGVVGAALATVISRYVEASVNVIWVYSHKDKYPYFKGMFKTLKVPGELAKKFFVTGMPILLNEGLWSVGVAMLAQAYSTRGLNVVAGQNIASTINNIFNIVFISMGDSVAIIIGQYLGAGDMKKARDTDNKIIACSIFTSILIGCIMFATAGQFPKLYNTNNAAKLIATHFIMIQAIIMPKDAFLHTSYFTIRAGGKTIITFLFDSVFMLLISVPVAYVLSIYTSLDAAYIFALVHAADLIKCVIGFVLIKKGVWMNNIVKD